MKITRIEVDGVMYRTAESQSGDTYCEECDLNEKCVKKEESVNPCCLIGEEEVFVYETDITRNT